MNVYIIIVTYNGLNWIDKCLAGIYSSTIPLQPIVIDNGSKDGTQNYIQTNFPEVIFFQNKENLGFGKANNIGLKYALEHDCDYVYLLNQDAWLKSDTIEILINIHQNHKEYGILSPLQLNSKEDALESIFADFCAEKRCHNLFFDMHNNKSIKDVYQIFSVPAAHWLISRQCLLDVGFFAPIFSHYGEDDNYAQRCNYHHYKIGVCPTTSAIHDKFYTKKCTKLYPAFLTHSCNINSNFLFSISKGYFCLIFGYLFDLKKNKSIKHLSGILTKDYWKNLLKGVFEMPNILKTRNASKKNNSFIGI